MRFNILVTGGVYASQSAYSALQFCKAAINDGHCIDQVFFYQDGVTQASELAVALSDEFQPLEHWVELAQQHNVPLIVCVSAAERRGVLNSEQAEEFAKNNSNLHASFSVEGLGVMHDASLNSDRTVVFK